jgi:hypothetical protein
MKPFSKHLLPALPLLCVAAIGGAQEPEEERAFYRVEAIVFTQAVGASDAWPAEELADHHGALDPAWRAFGRAQRIERTERESDRDDLESALDIVDALASLESGERSLADALLYPEPWLGLDRLSDPMSEALERLERNGGYRIRDVLAWYQPLEQPADSRPIRLHDDRVIRAEWVTLDPIGRLSVNGRPVTRAEQLAPKFQYRLDGHLRLRQRQFLHADLTLDWRVPEVVGPSLWPVWNDSGHFSTHRLQQSRTVRPDRFEYFDSGWLGVLLRITPFEPEPVSEEDAATADAQSGSDGL